VRQSLQKPQKSANNDAGSVASVHRCSPVAG